MNLKQRPIRLSDIPTCVEMLKGHRAYDQELLALLPRVWERLLERRSIIFEVLEDRHPVTRLKIVGFGASVFVTDEFMRTARMGCEPPLMAKLIGLESKGRGSPILKPAAVASMNDGGGLNVLILHYCEAAGLQEGDLRQLRFAMLDGFLRMHRGYRIKEVLQELWDEIDPAYIQNGWGHVRTNDAQPGAAGLEWTPGSGPIRIGLDREEALAWPGSAGASLFTYTPPRLALSKGGRELLRRAVLGETDAELARSLHLSPSTVKSRWSAIYHSVHTLMPELLDELTAIQVPTRLQRGKEKRRRVIEYVSRHSEEFCLLAAPRAKAPLSLTARPLKTGAWSIN
jgi:DNA-binding CsgD family transcriptional regulator